VIAHKSSGCTVDTKEYGSAVLSSELFVHFVLNRLKPSGYQHSKTLHSVHRVYLYVPPGPLIATVSLYSINRLGFAAET
jgi:hypothetical protein